MFLILVSLLAGYIGMAIGGYILAIVGLLSPTMFLLQKMYIKLEELEKKLD